MGLNPIQSFINYQFFRFFTYMNYQFIVVNGSQNLFVAAIMNIYGIQRARKAEVSDFVEMIRAKVVLGRAQTVCQTVISRLENFHPDFLYNFEIVSINIRRNRVSRFTLEDRYTKNLSGESDC